MANTYECTVPYEERIEREDGEVDKKNIKPLPESFGKNLDTVDKAREWLTNPHNWRDGELFILCWDGLLPKISKYHGMRLRREWWDNGLPWCVMQEQRKRRSRSARGEMMEEKEQLDDENVT